MEREYLVIAELKYTGFIIGASDDHKAAERKAERIYALSDYYPFNQLYKLKSHLLTYESYNINGNAEYFWKCKSCQSNGAYSVYIVEIDESFSIQQFISERSSTSYAIISDETTIELLFYAN